MGIWPAIVLSTWLTVVTVSGLSNKLGVDYFCSDIVTDHGTLCFVLNHHQTHDLNDAICFCENENATLAEITSTTVHNLIKLHTKMDNKTYRLDLTLRNGTWEWWRGAELDNHIIPWFFNNQSGNGENAVFYKGYQLLLRDVPDSYKAGVLCQRFENTSTKCVQEEQRCALMNSSACKSIQAYAGNHSITIEGENCQRWDRQYPHKHNKTDTGKFPSSDINHNHCRNPDAGEEDGGEGPWCYTTNPYIRWDYCFDACPKVKTTSLSATTTTINITPCTSGPCQNGATCIKLDNNDFLCSCAAGFQGRWCEIDITPCAFGPCQNGATCIKLDNNDFLCSCAAGFEGRRCEIVYKNCAEIKENILEAKTGEYTVQLDQTVNSQIRVYCDMETLGGGWTVFQRRINGEQNFNKSWEQYKQGFGNLRTEFWLGNIYLHKLTNQGEATDLLIELKEWEQSCLLDAQYANFIVESESSNFRMTVGQFIKGLAGDSLKTPKYSNSWKAVGMQFSTYDKDNDKYDDGNCAFYGGWWYNICSASTLNGIYQWHNCGSGYGIVYFSASTGEYYSFEGAEMKLRKNSYNRTNNRSNWCDQKQTTCSCTTSDNLC